MTPKAMKDDYHDHGRFTHAGDLTGEPPTKEFCEIRIPVPWGHISGKWYGRQNVRPIVGLHGWQDNAGTFDTLVPLLVDHIGFLSIDLPGHGLSSRLPDGIYYNSVDNVYIILMIMKQYNWDKISIIGHSMSALIGFAFAAIYPEKIDLLIGLDALKPHQRPVKSVIKTISSRLEGFLKQDERNRNENEPPSYTYDELIERLSMGTFLSVRKDCCKYLLARNIKKSEKFPDKYYFARDRRLQYYNYMVANQEVSIEMAKRINTPYLFIKATESSFFEERKYYDEVLEILKARDTFEVRYVVGTHHVHLNDPQSISGIINSFILKYRPPTENSSKL